MRAVVQRVHRAHVSVGEKVTGSIEKGLFILLGVGTEDTTNDMEWLVNKICQLRIFNDDEGRMNRSLEEVRGGALIVSQFTLHAQYKKGNRPSFLGAARPEQAEWLYLDFCRAMRERLGNELVGTGIFGEHMDIHAENDGPVTLVLDTKNKE